MSHGRMRRTNDVGNSIHDRRNILYSIGRVSESCAETESVYVPESLPGIYRELLKGVAEFE